MSSFWRSYALLQHAQQVLVVLVLLAWQHQQQQMCSFVAALLLWETCKPDPQQCCFFAATAAAGEHLEACSCVSPPRAAPAVHVFTRHCRTGSRATAGKERTGESGRVLSASTAAVTLTSESRRGGPAEGTEETLRRHNHCSKSTTAAAALLFHHEAPEKLCCVSAAEVSKLRGASKIPPPLCTYGSFVALLPVWGFPPARAAAGGAAPLRRQLEDCDAARGELSSCFSWPKSTAHYSSAATDEANTLLPARASCPATAALVTPIKGAARTSARTAPNSLKASAFAELSTSRLTSSSTQKFPCFEGRYKGSCMWRTAASSTPVAVVALLSPCVKQQSATTGQQQQCVSQLLPPEVHAGKKKNSVYTNSDGGKSCGQSTTQYVTHPSCLCCSSSGAGRAPEAAATMASFIRRSACWESVPRTSGEELTAGTTTMSGAQSSSATAAAAPRRTETVDRAATAPATSGTTCSPVPVGGHSAAGTAEEIPVKAGSSLSSAAGEVRSVDEVDAPARHAATISRRWSRLTAMIMWKHFLITKLSRFLSTSQLEETSAPEGVAATAPVAAQEVPARAESEAAAGRQSPAVAAGIRLLKLEGKRPPARVAIRATGMATALKIDGLPRAAGKKRKQAPASAAADIAHAWTSTAVALSYFCRLRQLAFLEPELQRRRFGATGNAGETPDGAAAVEGGGVKGSRREGITPPFSFTDSSRRDAGGREAENKHIACREPSHSATPTGRMKKSLAWLFWKKKEEADEEAPDQKENGNRETAAQSGDASYIFSAEGEGKELFDKAAEEARRQAFRSPVTAALHRFWEETPKFTRLYLLSAFTLSLLSSLYGQSYPRLLSPAALVFNFPAIREKGQLHRLVTSLFFFGPLSLPTLLSLSFVHAYLGGLEQHFQRLEECLPALHASEPSRTLPRRLIPSFLGRLSYFSPLSPRHMFSRLLLSSAAAAMTLATLKQIPNEHLLQCISTSLLHVWSRLFPSGEADFYGLFTVSNEYLPFFFLAQNWLFEGRIVAADLYGIGIAALWLVLVQQRLEEHEERQQHQQRQQAGGQQQDESPR